ncbi:GNAT family N-acetyltransferase [Amycolatopsis japonica]
MTSARYLMHRATISDLPAVMSLLDARTAWLRTRETNQWTTREFEPVMRDAINRGETWLLTEAGRPVATLTLTTVADSDFWTLEERRTPAFYLSKLATRLDRKGEGLGAFLIDWAADYATKRGVLWLRWDVWRTNVDLQNYYLRLGATLIRTVDVPGRHSGALFELSKAARTDLDISTATEFAPVLTLPSTARESAAEILPVDLYGYAGVDSAGNQLGHEFRRIVDGWKISPLHTADIHDPTVALVSVSQHVRPLLHDAGDGWHLRGTFSKPVGDTWPTRLDPAALRRGQVYRLQLSTDQRAVQLFGDIDR